jgi:hypothetical protein
MGRNRSTSSPFRHPGADWERSEQSGKGRGPCTSTQALTRLMGERRQHHAAQRPPAGLRREGQRRCGGRAVAGPGDRIRSTRGGEERGARPRCGDQVVLGLRCLEGPACPRRRRAHRDGRQARGASPSRLSRRPPRKIGATAHGERPPDRRGADTSARSARRSLIRVPHPGSQHTQHRATGWRP